MFTGSKESLGIIKKVGEFRNKDAISLKRQPSDLCQMFSTTFNADYKNKDSMNEEQGQLLHRAIKIRTCFLEHAHTATFTAFQQITTNMVLCGSNLISDRLWNTRRIIAFHVVGPWLRPRYSSRFMRNISTAAITTECYWNSTENLVVWKKKKKGYSVTDTLSCLRYI